MTFVLSILGLLLGFGLMGLSSYLTVSMVKSKGIRETMYGWGIFLLNVGFILTILSIPLHELFPDFSIPFLSLLTLTFEMIGGLSILWGLFYYSHRPLSNLLLFSTTFMGGALWTFTIVRTLEGDVFLVVLVNNSINDLTWRTQLFGVTLVLLSLLTLILVFDDIKTRLKMAHTYPKEGLYLRILGLDELLVATSIGVGGASLVMKNNLSIPLFLMAMIVLIFALIVAQIVLHDRSYLLFPIHLEIMQAIDGENASIGWGFYVFGPLGPEPTIYKFNNLVFLPAKERKELIYELGIKLLSTPSFRGEYDQSTLRLTLTKPFEADLLFITTFITTEKLDTYDERFEQKPFAGFLLLVNCQKFKWILEYGSVWKEFVNSVVKDTSLEKLSFIKFEEGIRKSIYDIVTGRASLFHG